MVNHVAQITDAATARQEEFSAQFTRNKMTQLSLTFDPCAKKSRRNSNSGEAHKRVVPAKLDKWKQIYRIIELLGPSSSKELAAEMNVPLHHVTPRLSEMKFAGLLYEAVTAKGEPIRREGAAVVAVAKKWPEGESL